jgi:hypothetical protein
MRLMRERCLSFSTLAAIILLVLAGAAPSSFAQKLKPEEVVAKHLESLGSTEARAAVKSRVAQGAVVTSIRIGGSGQSRGGAVMASQREMSLIGLIFGPQDFANEKMAYDGNQVTVGEARPGVRTRLGLFLLTHDILFKEGLIGGTLSSAWPLLNVPERLPKLRYSGTKKIDGRQTHVLEYEPRSGGNLEIKMYFDAETFQHVRTEYEQVFSAPPVSRPEDAARQKETRFRLTEEFSDYRKEGGINLPHTYRLQFTVDAPNNPVVQDWVVSLNQFLFNKDLEAKQFDVNAK